MDAPLHMRALPAVKCSMQPYDPPLTVKARFLGTIVFTRGMHAWKPCVDECIINERCVAIHLEAFNSTPPKVCEGVVPCETCDYIGLWRDDLPQPVQHRYVFSCGSPGACKDAEKNAQCWPHDSPPPPPLSPPSPAVPAPSVLLTWHVPWLIAAVAAVLAVCAAVLLGLNRTQLHALRREITSLRRMLARMTFSHRGTSARFDPARETMHADELNHVLNLVTSGERALEAGGGAGSGAGQPLMENAALGESPAGMRPAGRAFGARGTRRARHTMMMGPLAPQAEDCAAACLPACEGSECAGGGAAVQSAARRAEGGDVGAGTQTDSADVHESADGERRGSSQAMLMHESDHGHDHGDGDDGPGGGVDARSV